MHRYILKRTISLLLTMLAVSLFSFVVVNAIPGEPAEVLTRHLFMGLEEAAPPDMVAEVSKRYDLDKSLLEQYIDWVGDVLHGDFGHSALYNRPVAYLIGNALIPTLLLAATAVLLSLLIGIPLGIYSALHRGNLSDWIVRIVTVFSISMPVFWIAVILILCFSLAMGVTPVAGYGGPEYLLLPALALAIHSSASLARIMRTSLIETMNRPFITFAKAKGLPLRDIVVHHALRNAMLPVITVVGMSFGGLLAGAVVIETVFAWPGLGNLLVKAISARDVVLIESTLVVIVSLYLVVNYVVDLFYTLVDPRIRYE
ncbi:MAG: ABC transporter permease [Methanolinea sp.]|nr:ABC transporter permease [Methanolinea sp.]